MFHIHIKQNKNLWRYFLRQSKRSFQTYPAYIDVKIKQNIFEMLIIVYFHFRSSIGIIGCLLARRNGFRFVTNPVSLRKDRESGNLDFSIKIAQIKLHL